VLDHACLRDGLQTREVVTDQDLEARAAISQRATGEVRPAATHQVKGQQHRRPSKRHLSSSASANAEPRLQRAEIGAAILVGEHDLAVDDRAR